MRESSMERSQVECGKSSRPLETKIVHPDKRAGEKDEEKSLRGRVISGYFFLPGSHLYKDVTFTYICMHMHSMCKGGILHDASQSRVRVSEFEDVL